MSKKMGQQFAGKEEYIKDVFSLIAPYYDRMNIIMSMGLLGYWRSFMLKCTGLKRGQWVLDVCTGTGDMAFCQYSLVEKEGRVIGLDMCEKMLAQAVKKMDSGNCESLDFICGNALELPFSQDTFDCVTSSFALRNISDISLAINEMVRVCKKGGRVVIMDITTPKSFVIQKCFSIYFNILIPLFGRIVDKGMKVRGYMSPYTWLSKSLISFPQDEEMANICKKAGLARVEYYSLTAGIVTVYMGVKE